MAFIAWVQGVTHTKIMSGSSVAQINPQVSHQQLVSDPCSTSTCNPMGPPVKTSPRTSKSARNWGSYGWFYWILQNQLQLPQFWSKNYVFRIIWKLTGRTIQTSALHMLPIPVTCAVTPACAIAYEWQSESMFSHSHLYGVGFMIYSCPKKVTGNMWLSFQFNMLNYHCITLQSIYYLHPKLLILRL